MGVRWAGLYLILLLVATAIAAPLITGVDPNLIPQGSARLSPSSDHWFGTDAAGRDIFARVVYGARVSLTVGVASAALATIIGFAVGVAAGWRGGILDSLLMRITEVFFVLPAVVIAGSMTVVLGRSLPTLIVILAAVGWPIVARVIRTEVIGITKQGYIEAARVTGSSPLRIVRRHVVAQLGPTVAWLAAAGVATSIAAEATLSYLGIGVAEPTASWGLMIASGQRFLTSDPHIVLFPAAAVFVAVLGFVLVSTSLRPAEPRP